MLAPVYTNQFEKGLKRVLRRGKDAETLKRVISMLVNETSLPQKHRDHALLGNFDKVVKSQFPLPWREGIKVRGSNNKYCNYLFITLTPTLSRQGRGRFFYFLRGHQF